MNRIYSEATREGTVPFIDKNHERPVSTFPSLDSLLQQLDDVGQNLVEDGSHVLLVCGEERVQQVPEARQQVHVVVVLLLELLLHVGVVVLVAALLLALALE